MLIGDFLELLEIDVLPLVPPSIGEINAFPTSKINLMKTLLYTCMFTSLCFSLLAQKVTIKDTDENVLVEINDEGTTGSIKILPGPELPAEFLADKLYNMNKELYWDGTKLGTIFNAGGWINEGPYVYLAELTDKVGIGSANPLSKLYVEEGTIQVNMGYISSSGVSDYGIYTRNDWLTEGALARKAIQSVQNPIKFFYGVQGIANDPTGAKNVGVYGTAANGQENWAGFFEGGEQGEPIAKFKSFPVGSHGSVRIENAAGNHFNLGAVQDPTNAFAINYNANIGALTDLMRINPDGKVGFGTTSPTGNLQVEGNTTSGVSLMIHNLNNAGSERLWFGTSSGIDAGMTVWGSNNSSNRGKYRFFNNKTDANYDWITSGNVRMTLANDGDLGLGATAPLAKMHIVQTGSEDAFRIDDALNDTSSFIVKSSGNIGIGTINPESKIHAKSGDKQLMFDFDYTTAATYETTAFGMIGSNLGAFGDFGCRKTEPNQNVTYYGVRGYSSEIGSSTNIGLYGYAGYGATNWAGFFWGHVKMGNDLTVLGVLSKGGGSFKIDHPLDPENKYLSHSFVESPDMMNIYNGNVILDDDGMAVVELPDWFSALNKDFRYQLTPIGAPGPGLFISEKIQDNQFQIAGGSSGMEVSWQVTGVRQDAFANKNRIKVEEDKPAAYKGTYLHPEVFGKTEMRKEDYHLTEHRRN